MTLESTKQIKCACGNMVSIKLYDSVNVSADPGLKEKIMKGEINSAICDKCGKPVSVDKYFLYHDEGNNTMIFVYPEVDRVREEEVKMEVVKSLRDSDKKVEAELGELFTPEKKKEFRETGIAVVFGQDELKKLIMEESK